MMGKTVSLPFALVRRVLVLGLGLVKLTVALGFGLFKFLVSRVAGGLYGATTGMLLGKKRVGVRLFRSRRR